MMNASFLSIPFAMLKGGFFYTLLLLLLNGVLNGYTAEVLTRSCALEYTRMMDSTEDGETNEVPLEQVVHHAASSLEKLSSSALPPVSEAQSETIMANESDEDNPTSISQVAPSEMISELDNNENVQQDSDQELQQPKLVATKQFLSYLEASRKSFGRIGELICSLTILLTDIGACAAYILVAANSLHLVYDKLSPVHYMLLSTLIILPFVYLKDVQKLSVMGSVGVLTFLGLIIVVVVYGFAIDGSHRIHSTSQLSIINWRTFFISFGICKFSFCGHEVFCTIRAGMPTQKHFTYAMVISCVFITAAAVMMGCAGYFMFTDVTPEYIMENFPEGTVFSNIVRVTVSLMLLASIPITIFAACELVEHYLKHLKNFKYYKFIDTEKIIPRIMIRTPLMFSSIGLAILVPNFTKQVSLVGGVGDSCLGLIFPILIYTKLHWKNITWLQLAMHSFTVGFGIFGIVCAFLVFIL